MLPTRKRNRQIKKARKQITNRRQWKQHTHRRRWKQWGGRPIKELQTNLADCGNKIEEAEANYSIIKAYVDNVKSSCVFWLEQATGFFNRSISHFEYLAIDLDGILERNSNAPVEYTILDEFYLLETLSKNIEQLCDETIDKQEWFMRLVITGDSKWMVQLLLLDPSVNPAANDNNAFLWASRKGNLAVVDLLLRDGRIDPTADNNYAIRMASSNGHLAVVDRLLRDPRVDPAAQDNYAIREASYYGHLAVVDRLLQEPIDRGVDPSADYNYAISMAYENRDFAMINRLLQDSRMDPSILEELENEHAKRKAWKGCSIQ
jgi:Ankyrin repeats (3 copies)